MTALPRHFVARADPEPTRPPLPATLGQLVDVLRWRRGGELAEVAVVRDLSGELHLWDDLSSLPDALHAAVSHQELVARPRTVDAADPWLLAVEALEQPPDAPGINDPIWLRGTLSGRGIRVPGRLGVTRGDLLAGLVEGRRQALQLAEAASAGGRSARCVHAALPGGRAEEIARGEGYVLAYPLVPLELQASDPANDPTVAQLAYDLLTALQRDLRASHPDHWLCGHVLPVPSRAELEERLRIEGWEIQGNVAIRPRGPKTGLTSLLTNVFGDPGVPRQPLPAEGTADDLLDIAAKMLTSFPGFPDERALALRARSALRTPSAAPPAVPKAPATPAPPKTPRPMPVQQPPAEDWRRDFSASKPASKERTKEAGRPAWMDDFDE